MIRRSFLGIAVSMVCVSVVYGQNPDPNQIRESTIKSLTLLTHSAGTFAKAQDCFSCHHSGLPLLAFRMARERGIPVDELVAKQVAVKSLAPLIAPSNIDVAVQAQQLIDPTPSDSYALMAADAVGMRPNLVTAIYARRIANWQRPRGYWVTLDQRPPHSNSVFTATATAIRAMRLYMPQQLKAEGETRIAQAKTWLMSAKAECTEDYAFRVFGLGWAGASATEIAPAVRSLLALQRADGGWGQLPHLGSDAYSTGTALAALHEAGGLAISDKAYQKGLAYLISTQAADGSWHVRTRMTSPAPISPAYFETDFPYKKEQFLSAAGTAWALMALMNVLPKVATFAPPPSIPVALPDAKPWMETALFGKAADLKTLLDGGLDANSQTAAGTSLLMMGVSDPEKVKLLLARGAKADAKAKSGYTSLMVAAIFRGSAESSRALLAAGAQATPGTGVKFNASPLVLTAMAGDLENANVLLKAGAQTNRKMLLLGVLPVTPLLASISFDNVDILKALLAAGADSKELDQDGMSLLHWAAVAGRPEAARALIEAGVPVTTVDRFGYTPLLYAATIDFGHTRVLSELIKGRPDLTVRDKQGRTAFAHAKEIPYLRAELEKAGARE